MAKILDIDGQYRDEPDFPVAVVREKTDATGEDSYKVIDPIFSDKVLKNLFGRVMTLVEATCEQQKLKAVKDLFAKELGEWESEVYGCARELSEGRQSSSNIYTR